MGEPIAGSIEKLSDIKGVQKNPSVQPAQSQPVVFPTPASNIRNPQDYIIVPGASYGKYSYPDLLVSTSRFYFNSTWQEAHEKLAKESSPAFMLTPRQFVDFLKVLRSGTAYDGTDKKLSSAKCDEILGDIYEQRSPQRFEWLDAKFESRGGLLGVIGSKRFISYEHTIQNGQLVSAHSEKLTDYLNKNMAPGGPGIDLTSWIENANEHGLPRANVPIPMGRINYQGPSSYGNEVVALFGACPGWVGLDCEEKLHKLNSSTGVRIARKKT